MRAERKRVRRLQRLEKIRAVAKQAAALEAAEAESTLAQLLALSERTGRMAADYGLPGEVPDAAALSQRLRFTAGLRDISASTRRDALQAQAFADRKQAELARAERSRAAVEARARETERAIAERQSPPALGARRPVGTGVE